MSDPERGEGATETPPNLDQLRPGTWAYSIDIYDRDHFGEQASLSLEETQAKLNEALAKVNDQDGRLVQVMEVQAKGESRPGIMGEIIEKGHIFIVEK